ncbi:hypothetical protein F5B20DRAFT_556963 [Whalleya microplaca]|nr:hypothetical protein F5B20DRAFT_556963 [Whalleya microplaca]
MKSLHVSHLRHILAVACVGTSMVQQPCILLFHNRELFRCAYVVTTNLSSCSRCSFYLYPWVFSFMILGTQEVLDALPQCGKTPINHEGFLPSLSKVFFSPTPLQRETHYSPITCYRFNLQLRAC